MVKLNLIFVLFLLFPSSYAFFNLYLNESETRRLYGVPGQLYYVKNSFVNDYSILFTLPLQHHMTKAYFNWANEGPIALFYNLSVSISDPHAMLTPHLSIPPSGVVPNKTSCFSIDSLCTGFSFTDVTITIKVDVATKIWKGGKVVGSGDYQVSLVIKRKKSCYKGKQQVRETTLPPMLHDYVSDYGSAERNFGSLKQAGKKGLWIGIGSSLLLLVGLLFLLVFLLLRKRKMKINEGGTSSSKSSTEGSLKHRIDFFASEESRDPLVNGIGTTACNKKSIFKSNSSTVATNNYPNNHIDNIKSINFSNMNNKGLLVNTNETSKAHYINSNPLINNKPQYIPTSLQQQAMQIMPPTNQCFSNLFLQSLSIPAYNVCLKNIIFQECDASLWKGMLQHHGVQKQVLVKMLLMGKEGAKVDNLASNIASFSSAPLHDHLCQIIATCVNNIPNKNLADNKYKSNTTNNNFNKQSSNSYDASVPSDSSSCNSSNIVNMLNNRRFDSNIINFINNNNNTSDNSDTFVSDYDNVYNTLSFTNNKNKRFDDYDNYANIDLLLNKEQNSTKLTKNRSMYFKNRSKDWVVTHCVLLMYPLVDEVNLKHFLLHKYDNQEPLTTEQLMCMCVQLASALQHLHHHQLLHQDLAVRNCLIDGCLTLKLCDNAFSHQLFPKEYEEPGLLSRHIMSQRRNEGPRPVRWMAVEQLQGAPNSKQTDMWSLGVTIWEMLTMGQLPYTSLPSTELLQFLKNSFRLPQPPICPDNLFSLLKCCWSEDQNSRPQVEVFKSSLHNMCMALVRGQ